MEQEEEEEAIGLPSMGTDLDADDDLAELAQRFLRGDEEAENPTWLEDFVSTPAIVTPSSETSMTATKISEKPSLLETSKKVSRVSKEKAPAKKITPKKTLAKPTSKPSGKSSKK